MPLPNPHAAANTPGRCEHRPLHGFATAAGIVFPRWPPCFPGSVGRAFTPAAPWRFKIGNINAAANTPCRGRFHIGSACLAADPCGSAVALPCKPGQTSWPPGLPKTKNFPVGAGFIPPAEPAPPRGAAGWGHPALRSPGRPRQAHLAGRARMPCRGGACPSREPRAAANRADMESAPTVHRGGCIFPGGRRVCPGSVGRAFTPAAPWRFKIGTFALPRGAAG